MVVGMKTRLLFLSMMLAVSFSNLQPMLATLTAGMRDLGLRVRPPKWDEKQFQVLLESQHYAELVHNLDYFLKDGKTYAIDWIAEHAHGGHVPLLYLVAKDYWLSAGTRSLSTKHLQEALTMVLVSLIRVKQDIACCRPFIEDSVTNLEDFYTLLKAKYWLWYGDILTTRFTDSSVPKSEQERLHKKLFAAVIADVKKWFEGRDFSNIHPAWIRACTGRASWGIDWGTKSLKTAREDSIRFKMMGSFNEARTLVLAEELKTIDTSQTFLKFFADVSPVDLQAMAEAKSPELTPVGDPGELDDEGEALELGDVCSGGKYAPPAKKPSSPPSHVESEAGEGSKEGVHDASPSAPPAKTAVVKDGKEAVAESA